MYRSLYGTATLDDLSEVQTALIRALDTVGADTEEVLRFVEATERISVYVQNWDLRFCLVEGLA